MRWSPVHEEKRPPPPKIMSDVQETELAKCRPGIVLCGHRVPLPAETNRFIEMLSWRLVGGTGPLHQTAAARESCGLHDQCKKTESGLARLAPPPHRFYFFIQICRPFRRPARAPSNCAGWVEQTHFRKSPARSRQTSTRPASTLTEFAR